MKYPTVFHLVSKEFGKANIPFILIGGFAVNAYKVSRSTGDVDFLIAEEDLPKVLHLMNENGYQKFQEGPSFARLSTSDMTKSMIVDFVLVDSSTLNKLLIEANKSKIAGIELFIPSLNHLIALKLHAIKNNSKRESRDLMDILDLIRKNGIDVHTDEFRLLCLKFGSENLYNKIKTVFK